MDEFPKLLTRSAAFVASVLLAVLVVAERCIADPPAPAAPAASLGIGPYLQWAAPGGMTFAWTTDRPVRGVLRFAPASAVDHAEAWGEVVEEEVTVRHRVTVDILDPGRGYFYRVAWPGFESEAWPFHTAPEGSAPFTFVAYGDSRSAPATHRAVADRIVALRPDLVLHTGDLVEDDAKDEQWRTQFFDPLRPLLRGVPLYPSLGNHERKGRNFQRYFDLPAARRYYSFDYAGGHFVALDAGYPGVSAAAQRRWLDEDLAAASGADLRIAFFHQPAYGCSDRFGRSLESSVVRDAFVPILKRHGVRLVFSGHHHNYQHAIVDGMHFVVTAGGGAPLYDLGEVGEGFVKVEKAHHVVRASVQGKRLHLEAVRLDGSLIEQFDVEGP
ncbi:MAG: metallophosphoesterase family protein [Planctomycetes bacterium]|nr:metallophosphoesterase family protein [Planctomycetota bacterium]